tara:strand:+ start:1065 stop:1292 length:228 start_codon:yes stop_codon:yes gene_type:complete
MDWEVHDYRNKPPVPTWTEWHWPKDQALWILWRIFFWTVVIPFALFGTILTPLGFLIQLLIIDYVTYLQWKNSIT